MLLFDEILMKYFMFEVLWCVKFLAKLIFKITVLPFLLFVPLLYVNFISLTLYAFSK